MMANRAMMVRPAHRAQLAKRVLSVRMVMMALGVQPGQPVAEVEEAFLQGHKDKPYTVMVQHGKQPVIYIIPEWR